MHGGERGPPDEVSDSSQLGEPADEPGQASAGPSEKRRAGGKQRAAPGAPLQSNDAGWGGAEAAGFASDKDVNSTTLPSERSIYERGRIWKRAM